VFELQHFYENTWYPLTVDRTTGADAGPTVTVLGIPQLTEGGIDLAGITFTGVEVSKGALPEGPPKDTSHVLFDNVVCDLR
jgi:hypothetical protein